jgi:hypothetical protein
MRATAPPRSQFDGTLSVVPTSPYEAIVGTNVHYAVLVESGTRRMAPRGMFRLGIAEIRGQLEQNIRERLNGRA